jgi:hypothetical protein
MHIHRCPWLKEQVWLFSYIPLDAWCVVRALSYVCLQDKFKQRENLNLYYVFYSQISYEAIFRPLQDEICGYTTHIQTEYFIYFKQLLK